MSKNTKYNFNPLLIHDPTQQSEDWWKANPWNCPLEIISGAIDSSSVHKNLFGVQANTSKGLWDMHAIHKSQVSADDLSEFLNWKTRNVPIVIPISLNSTSVAMELPATIENSIVQNEEGLDDWTSSPVELLAKLQDLSITRDELFEAILFAEIAEFDAVQTEQLVPRLFVFVAEYRLAQEDEVKTAVGAAIRKLAMNLQDVQIEKYANLFLPTDTETLPCEIELELSKAILWRFAAEPKILSREFPKLESRLADLTTDYLKPRLILQKNYASIVLQAALCVLVLNGPHAESLLRSIKDLSISWFTDLFQRRLEKLRKQFVEIGDVGANAVADNLARFESDLQRASL